MSRSRCDLGTVVVSGHDGWYHAIARRRAGNWIDGLSERIGERVWLHDGTTLHEARLRPGPGGTAALIRLRPVRRTPRGAIVSRHGAVVFPDRHAAMVERAVRRYRGTRPSSELEDARAAGMLELVQRAHGYDPARGSFYSWAHRAVASAVRDALLVDSDPVLGSSGNRIRTRLAQAREHLGPEATLAQVAEFAGVGEATARAVMSARARSLDSPATHDGDPLSDLLADANPGTEDLALAVPDDTPGLVADLVRAAVTDPAALLVGGWLMVSPTPLTVEELGVRLGLSHTAIHELAAAVRYLVWEQAGSLLGDEATAMTVEVPDVDPHTIQRLTGGPEPVQLSLDLMV